MRTEQKTSVKNSVGRVFAVGVSVIIQVCWIVQLFSNLNEYSTTISLISSFLTLSVVLTIYGMHTNAAFKMPWIILILTFPILGLCIFFLFGRSNLTRGIRIHFEQIDKELFPKISQDKMVHKQLEQCDYAAANQTRYVSNYAHFPVWSNTDVTYYSEASEAFEAQLEALKSAEKFIFLEYHAIQEAEAFSRMRDILQERAAAGVEVRIVYDDMGSVGFINTDFMKRMEKLGIECRVFNRVIPIINVFMNNRDHRKITVIDGKVGFTGGYNLADEYFNLTHPYGRWKDTGIRVEGDAVKNLTVLFLEMWNAIKKSDKDFDRYLVPYDYKAKEHGFIQPYGDSPLDDEYVGENVYLNMIKNAKHYIYFTTPYLIITDEMTRELGLAAKRGVDVRIITPGIPDKKLVYKVTRSYYAGLVKNGVRIFEYTPGFLHAKQCVCDGETAVIGTINLDFRSLYLHFENAAYLYGYDCIRDMKKDFDETFAVSSEVTEHYKSGRPAVVRGTQCILRLFAPLL